METRRPASCVENRIVAVARDGPSSWAVLFLFSVVPLFGCGAVSGSHASGEAQAPPEPGNGRAVVADVPRAFEPSQAPQDGPPEPQLLTLWLSLPENRTAPAARSRVSLTEELTGAGPLLLVSVYANQLASCEGMEWVTSDDGGFAQSEAFLRVDGGGVDGRQRLLSLVFGPAPSEWTTPTCSNVEGGILLASVVLGRSMGGTADSRRPRFELLLFLPLDRRNVVPQSLSLGDRTGAVSLFVSPIAGGVLARGCSCLAEHFRYHRRGRIRELQSGACLCQPGRSAAEGWGGPEPRWVGRERYIERVFSLPR